MIDPADPPEIQIAKQRKIIDALMRRVESGTEMGSSAWSLFNSAISLQSQVWAKTRDLEQALDTLSEASDQLESAQEARRAIQSNLADALASMESGFALFSEDGLQICNDLFRTLLPDLSRRIRRGMPLDTYLDALHSSRFVDPKGSPPHLDTAQPPGALDPQGFILPIKGDRWVQITRRKTAVGHQVVLQTEVTGILRRNRAERVELIDSQARFLRTAFDHLRVGVGIFANDGTLIGTNARFCTLLDLPIRLTDIGTDIAQIVQHFSNGHRLSFQNRAISYTRWLDELRKGAEANWYVRHENGAMLDLSMLPLPGEAWLLTVRDSTAEIASKDLLEQRVAARTRELTHANAALRAKNDELEQIRAELQYSKDLAEAAVRSKTRFLAAASHDLLQPINAAKLFLSSLTESPATARSGQVVERLERSFASLERQFQALLEISRLDSTGVAFDVTDFPLARLLEQVEADTAVQAERRGLGFTIRPSALWVRSDLRYLTRSVQNLVLNAIHYTGSGRILVACRSRGDQVAIEVWDSGAGIAEADQQRIFEAFARGVRAGHSDGMGLGLSIVDQACRQLGHPIHLCSREGHGSMFRITVPLAQPERDQAPAIPHPPHDAETDMDLIILVVENDPDVLLATSERLEMWGASVLAATSRAGAAAHIKEIGMAPDLLIVDYQLDDDDDGVQVIRALRAMTGVHLPAIMITASRLAALAQEAVREDFTLLTKPVQLARLRPLIDWKTRAHDTDKSIK